MESEVFVLAASAAAAGAHAMATTTCKLIDTVREVLEPDRVRRLAAAKADALKIETTGELDAEDLIDRRAQFRLARTAIQEQRNLEAITQNAAGQLEQWPGEVSIRRVDPDWTAAFFDACKNFSDDKMQLLWGKILAGEVANPGSFSRRTIAAVRVLSGGEAECFNRFCSFAWQEMESGARYFAFIPETVGKFETIGMPIDEVSKLDSAGLVRFTGMTVGFDNKKSRTLAYMGTRYILVPEKPITPTDLGQIYFTDVGQELVCLCHSRPQEGYLRECLRSMFRQGVKVITSKTDGDQA